MKALLGAIIGFIILCGHAQAYTSPYTCTRNFYVATTGSDSTSCGASATPCASIGGAMSSSGWSKNIGGSGTALTGGDCLNVAPGTYTASGETWLYQGGNANTATGYVAIVGDPTGNNRPVLEVAAGKCVGGILGFNAKTGATSGSDNGSFIILDGLEVNANNQCADYLVGGGGGGGTNTIHHIMVLNSHVHGAANAGGIGFAGGDYIFIAGNTVHDNKSEWQSGISVYEPSYIIPNLAWPLDNQAYHIQFLQNVSYNNGSSSAGACNSGHTDGEGIIADDWQSAQKTGGIPYSGKGLIQSNVVYGNGGKGIQVGPTSLNVTVNNNTSYNNNLDPTNCGTWRGELHDQDSFNTIWTNNVGYAVPGTGKLANNVSFLWGTVKADNDKAVTFTNNDVFGGIAGNCGGKTILVQTQNSADCGSISGTANLIGVDPKFVSTAPPVNLSPSVGSPLFPAGQSSPPPVPAPPPVPPPVPSPVPDPVPASPPIVPIVYDVISNVQPNPPVIGAYSITVQ